MWGVVGYGTGSLTLTPKGGKLRETDMDLEMAAVGLRGVALQAPRSYPRGLGASTSRFQSFISSSDSADRMVRPVRHGSTWSR